MSRKIISYFWCSLLDKPIKFIRKLFYRGSSLRCNICENTFRRFLPVKAPYRPNAKCPYCRSTEADRVLWFYLSNEILAQKNKKKFLYVGPHPHTLGKLKLRGIQADTLQLEYFTMNQHEIAGTRLRGGIYDVVVFSHQLQFLTNDDAVFAELKRLLRTGGLILIQTIVHPGMDRTYEQISTPEDRDRLKEYYEPGAKSIYGINFHKHLRRAGFQVSIIDFAQQLGEGAIGYYGLGNGVRETIYQCKKP